MKTVFEFDSYKDYLRSLLKREDSRGLLSKLAAAAECQRPYLSKVLQIDSNVHLTPDHMFGICEYLQLTELESDGLKLLLEKERASQVKYRQSLQKRLIALKEQYLNLKKQLGKEQISTGEDAASFYYSYWLYSALHIAVSIPSLQTALALARRFLLPEETIIYHLKKLEKLSLVKEHKNKWQWQSGDIHLSKDSYLVFPIHINWRNQAVQNLSLRQSDSIHYSVVQSLSHEDCESLRIIMADLIKRFQKIATPSKSEELVCFNLDFFKVGYP